MKITKLSVRILICDRSGYSNKLLSQFGLSMLLDIMWDDGSARRIMFDTGWDWPALVSNIKTLGLDLKSIQSLVLSHCHYDHTGGLQGLLEKDGFAPHIYAHKEILRPAYTDEPDVHFIGLNPAALQGLSPDRLHFIEGPTEICPSVFLTGQIPRSTDFEKPEKHVFIREGDKLFVDLEQDDMAIAVDLGEKGLVVITGCSHAGIINTVHHARRITQNHGSLILIGGFHLIDASDAVRDMTIEALCREDITEIYTGHCTGFAAEKELSYRFVERFHMFYTGDTIRLI